MRIAIAAIVAALATGICASDVRNPAAQSAPACRVSRAAISSGPYAELCSRLVGRWRLLFGESIAEGTIHLGSNQYFTGSATERDWTLTWPAPRVGVRLNTSELEQLIPHEAAHKAFGTYVYPIYRSAGGPRHYSSALPDWLDEAPAVWMESAAFRQRRVNEVRGTTASLVTLVTMEHPHRDLNGPASDGHLEYHVVQRTTMPPCSRCTWRHDTLRTKYEVTEVRLNTVGVVDTVVRFLDHDPANLDTLEKKQFYPLVYTLLRFVHLRGGAPAVRELIARYRANLNAGAEVLTGLPGMPATVTEVERAWHSFLKTMSPEVE